MPTQTELLQPSHLFSNPHAFADAHAWHAAVGDLRAEEGIVRAEPPGHQPFTVLLRHRDVFEVSRTPEIWHNTHQSVLMPDADWQRLIDMGVPLPSTLIHLDGQTHRDHRAVTSDWFKPPAVAKRQQMIDDLADEFIDKMASLGGSCDFATDIAQPYTLRAIMDLYGVPRSDERLMLELTQGLFGAADPEFIGDDDPETKAITTMMTFIQYFNEMTSDRRACPADDLASIIANGEVNGELMADNERIWYFIIVATAGHDTTSFALSGGLEAMLRDPSQLAALRDEPDLLAGATEEVIRWTSPVKHFLRYAQRDVTIADVEIPAGERVLLSYPSANRDEDVFADAMTFDVRRTDADKMLGFGKGAHFCLGAHFARRELRTFLGRMAQHIEHIELDGEPRWAESHFVSGCKHLPVAYSMR